MTNHTYFNLAGHNAGMNCEHFFVANAAHYLPINEQNIPTGEIAPVEGTPFDFRELRPVAPGMEADDPQIKQARGYDHCLCIDGYQYGRNLRRALHVEEMWTGRELDYFTHRPGRASSTPATGWATNTPKTMPTIAGAPALPSRQRCTPTRRTSRCSRRGIVGPGHPYSNVIEYHFMRH